MDKLLKSVLKRQLPYLIGGTITGAIMTYSYGFLITVIVNSIIWFLISTVVNKYYWHYTGFRDEMALASKYIGRIKNKDSKNNIITKAEFKKEESDNPKNSISKDIDEEKNGNIENNSKF